MLNPTLLEPLKIIQVEWSQYEDLRLNKIRFKTKTTT